jgi:hypothetical protein
VTLKRGHLSKYLRVAFTEHGAIMAAAILNSPEAAKMSVYCASLSANAGADCGECGDSEAVGGDRQNFAEA